MKNNLAEYKLTAMWRDLISRENVLVTENGEPLRIIYPGRINDNRGADFRDAVILNGDHVQRGDIELHVKSGDWQSHGHHLDPAYNRVILHVVFQEDSPLTMHRANGEMLPTLNLGRYLEKRLQPAAVTLPCSQIAAANPEKVKEILDVAGEARFRSKATEFQVDLARVDAGQVLFRGIMGALGYAKNKIPCLKLAEYITLETLASLTQNDLDGKNCLMHHQAWLLGTAGLLPAQRSIPYKESADEYVNNIERFWSLHNRGKSLPPGSWNLFKVRPHNSPLRRLVALTYLLQRYRKAGLLASIVAAVEAADTAYPQCLAAGLMVGTDGYWATHYDFGRMQMRIPAALLGPDKAAEIIINVILPFVYAWDNTVLSEKALAMYRRYPLLPSNAIERHLWQQLGLSKGFINSARCQQGLIHIYKTLCIQGKCSKCSLSK